MPDPTSDTLDRIHDRIAKAAPAGVWSRADFLDIGTPNAVEKALQRLTRRCDIRRPYRGLYDKPGISKLTGRWCFRRALRSSTPLPARQAAGAGRRHDRRK